MKVEYYIRYVYGKPYSYIVDPQIFVAWNEISNQKTITPHQIDLLERNFGVQFELVQDPYIEQND